VGITCVTRPDAKWLRPLRVGIRVHGTLSRDRSDPTKGVAAREAVHNSLTWTPAKINLPSFDPDQLAWQVLIRQIPLSAMAKRDKCLGLLIAAYSDS
jgi:hypothetical protein